MQVSRKYGVLIEEKGITLRGSFLIDPKGVLRQLSVNDLPVGRSVDEALRLVKAFQFTVSFSFSFFFEWFLRVLTLYYYGRIFMARCAPLTGRRARRPSARILLRSLSTLPRSKTVRRVGLSVRASTEQHCATPLQREGEGCGRWKGYKGKERAGSRGTP